MPRKIAIRFCPPIPVWGSQRTFAHEFLPRVFRLLPDPLVYSSLVFKDPDIELIKAENPLLLPGLARRCWALMRHQLTFAGSMRKKGIEVLFCPFANEGLAWSGGIRQVVIVHDLVPLRFPRDYKLSWLLWQTLYGAIVRRAQHVICPSQATCNDVINLLGLPANKVSVVPLGYTLPQSALPRRPQRHILYVASAHSAHKNIAALLEAFATSTLLSTYQLRIIGIPHRRTTPALQTRADQPDVAGRVHFLSEISADAMESEYAAAQIFVYPSLCEGFGLPLLDAMARSVPICAARGSSVSEVGGDAAIYFDPRDINDIRLSMERLTTDEGLRDQLTARGLARVQEFSWDKCAAQCGELCLEVAGIAPKFPTGRAV